jgi:hypothetical protein
MFVCFYDSSYLRLIETKKLTLSVKLISTVVPGPEGSPTNGKQITLQL